MRWSLQWQFLGPMITVLVLAIGLSSLTSAYLSSSSLRKLQQEQLERAVRTLSEATFPLTPPVLESIRKLTGAEYAVLSSTGEVQSSTLPLDDEILPLLPQQQSLLDLADPSQQRPLTIAAKHYLAARIALKRQANGGQSLLVLVPQSEAWSTARQAAWPPLVAGSVALMVSLILTSAIARRILQPVRQLRKQAERIAAGDFRPVSLPRLNDEIRDLSQSINFMASRLESYTEQVRRRERLRALDLLSSGLAHQLRNGVTGARLAIELHRRDCTAAGDESLGVCLSQLALMESYLQRFLTLGKTEAGARTRLEVGQLLDEVLDLVRPVCLHASVQLEMTAAEEPLWIEADPGLLRQMLMNLLLNALEAARTGSGTGRVCVICDGLGEQAVIRIGDSGPGPAADMRESLFEPFVSDKPDGTGLGLAVARQIVECHGGTIAWHRESEMTWFTVHLPRCAANEDATVKEQDAYGTLADCR